MTNGDRTGAGTAPSEMVALPATETASPGWLVTDEVRAVARGGVFFYPCAGTDTEEALAAFAPDVTTFWFCDPTYRADTVGAIAGCERTGPVSVQGEPNAAMVSRETEGRIHRWIEPCVWTAPLRHQSTGADVTAHWRRGFGEYALAREFKDCSISVFMHRGDSPGEGGSGAHFLDRRPKRHEPLAFLFDKLAAKLRDEALVVTDGSNCGILELRTFHRDRATEGPRALEALAGQIFERWGFRWTCVGHLGPKYGPTLIWKLRRLITLTPAALKDA
ncbi:hypothetical protein [Methylobacterium aquaticum]|uniref:Uncharacterized protein n=1 Tax=Methylobacterium aquaticum TaxID=270351 RepID=A0A0C6FKY8_9HYPH|nr:hypothetical protein [Methylobacterium aquaticum]BAQ45814.1 hypothetical protein Maq22A_c12895 [Methylobacterium aquaticum]